MRSAPIELPPLECPSCGHKMEPHAAEIYNQFRYRCPTHGSFWAHAPDMTTEATPSTLRDRTHLVK